MILKVQLDEGAFLPERAYKHDAGAETDGREGKDSGGPESDNAGDNDRKEKEDEMTNGWRLTIKKRWSEYAFRFETLVEAGEFISAFARHIEPDEDEDDAKYPWNYSITPIVEKEEENDA